MSTQTPENFAQLVGLLLSIMSLIVPLLFGITFLFLIWKIVDTWIISGGEPTKIAEGKKYVLVGIIALVVMSGIWGILRILQSSLFDV